MSREEDVIRTTTRAIADTVREVPPLRLDPAPGGSRSHGRWPRRTWRRGSSPRLRSWLAPVAAAAVVVAVAVALVLVRGPQHVGVVPQPALSDSGPGGVPRYYVAVDPAAGPGSSDGLLVGDTVTGKTIPVMPPPHMSFESVTAAADDRTFFVFASEAGGSPTTGLWFMLVLAPGTDHVLSYGSTAIAQQSGVAASALSASGKYLAVAENGPAKGQQRVVVFAVATGRPLQAWSTKTAPATWLADTAKQNLLTWIDGDRAIAFSGYDLARGTVSVRRLSFPMQSGHGDLITDSQLIWSTSMLSRPSCWLSPPVVSADGKTIACAAYSLKQPSAGDAAQWTFSWHAYRASAQAPAAGKYTIAYQVTRSAQGTPVMSSNILWVSPSASTLIGEWTAAPLPVVPASSSTSSSSGKSGGSTASMVLVGPVPTGAYVHIGVISHGTFTPLRLPPGLLAQDAGTIAW